MIMKKTAVITSIIIVLAVGTVVFFYLRKKKKEKEQEQEQQVRSMPTNMQPLGGCFDGYEPANGGINGPIICVPKRVQSTAVDLPAPEENTAGWKSESVVANRKPDLSNYAAVSSSVTEATISDELSGDVTPLVRLFGRNHINKS